MNSTIYSLFVAMALRVTVITAFVMLIKAIFRQKLSAAAHCAVWIIPAVQVVFCIGNVSIPTKASIYNVVGEVAVSAGAAVAPQAAHIDVKNIIALVYCIGIVVLALWYLTVFVVHRVRMSRLERITDEVTLGILRELISELSIRENITLRQGKTAQTLGRTVILPDGYTPDEQRQILLHELCHYRNRDNAKLVTAAAMMCLNWFNPFMWLSFRRFRADVEMYCDDNVMKLTNSRKGYAMVLVKTATKHAMFIPGATGVSGGKHEVTRRVKRIVSWKKKKPVWLAAAVCACITVSCLCLTDAVSTAVENNVDAAATPEPVEVVPAIIDAAQSIAEPEPTEPQAEPESEPQSDTVRESEPPRSDASDADAAAGQISAAESEGDPVRSTVSEQSVPVVPDTVSSQSIQAEVSEPERPGGAAGASASYGSIEMPSEPETYTEDTSEQPPADETEDIYSSLGEPESVSANGNKETYSLDDGRTAVLHYDDGELETGYIINSGSEESGEMEAAE